MSFKDQVKRDLETVFFNNSDEFEQEVSYFDGADSTTLIVQMINEESDLVPHILRHISFPVDRLLGLSKSGYFTIDGEKYGVLDFYPDEEGLIMHVMTQKGLL